MLIDGIEYKTREVKGKFAFVYTREFFDYFTENVIEILQISVAIVLGLLLRKNATRLNKTTLTKNWGNIFRSDMIFNPIIALIKYIAYSFLKTIANMNNKLSRGINICFFKMLYGVGVCIGCKHRSVVFLHASWILFGVVVAVAAVFLRER